jgi:hypothetical protein
MSAGREGNASKDKKYNQAKVVSPDQKIPFLVILYSLILSFFLSLISQQTKVSVRRKTE